MPSADGTGGRRSLNSIRRFSLFLFPGWPTFPTRSGRAQTLLRVPGFQLFNLQPSTFNLTPTSVDGSAWIILSLTGVLSPQFYDKVFTCSQPAAFEELTFMFWLVINGARPPADGVCSR
jgi:hypothetical protein